MKIEQKKEAIRLRKEEGLSIGVIAKKLLVSKGTVSLWVRGIELTDEQKKQLEANFKGYGARTEGATSTKQRFKDKRVEWQKQGRAEANRDWLHVAGCMLYWAEGHKRNNRTSVRFSNSELTMLKLFLRFLRECFGVLDDRVTVTVNCYTDLKSLSEIEEYWLNGLGLPRSCLRKFQVDCRPACTQGKMKGLPYGTCRIVVCDVSIMQRIYGAIQEYGGFENEELVG
jgi:transcriptional regulator with XRE-family HTH domain